MKPMILKEPTPCCGAPVLEWVAARRRYVCPCGKMDVNEYGHTKAKQNQLKFKQPFKKP